MARLKAMSERDRLSTLHQLVADSIHEITESEEFYSTQATTNAVLFGIDGSDGHLYLAASSSSPHARMTIGIVEFLMGLPSVLSADAPVRLQA